MIKTLPSNVGAVGSIPSQGTEIPLALRSKNGNTKQKQHCNKFNKGLKKWSTSKNKVCWTFGWKKLSPVYLSLKESIITQK